MPCLETIPGCAVVGAGIDGLPLSPALLLGTGTIQGRTKVREDGERIELMHLLAARLRAT